MKVTLVVTALNELVGMKVIMPRIRRELFEQIIIVDGGSTDGTIEYALANGYEVHRQKLRGIRLGLVENYPNIRGDFMITFSPDGNSIPELLPQLITKLKEGYDMVVVSRYLEGAKSEDDTAATSFGNSLFTGIVNLLFGGRYTDALVMFRGYKRELPEKLGITRIRSNFYERWIGRYISWEPQLSVRASKFKLKITEIPGDEPPRIADTINQGSWLLPASRIQHFKSGLACLYMFTEEFLKRS